MKRIDRLIMFSTQNTKLSPQEIQDLPLIKDMFFYTILVKHLCIHTAQAFTFDMFEIIKNILFHIVQGLG